MNTISGQMNQVGLKWIDVSIANAAKWKNVIVITVYRYIINSIM